MRAHQGLQLELTQISTQSLEGFLDVCMFCHRMAYDVCFYDEDREIMWFPSIVNMGKMGMIYPEGTKNNWLYKKSIRINKYKLDKKRNTGKN